MAIPNDSVPPKKPAPPAPKAPPPGKPAPPSSQGSNPEAQPAGGAKPGVKPAEGAKPAGAKPQVAKPGPVRPAPGKAAQKPGGGPPKKAPVKTSTRTADGDGRGGGRKFGQVLVDLGFVDEDQLWEILDEAKNSGQPVGQVCVARGLITDDQLLLALAEQHGLKTVNLEEVKPLPEALQLVPETMASVYKILPLTFKDKVLTIAMSDPSNMATVDDLRNLLGINEVKASLASAKAITEGQAKAYAGKEESIIDIIQQLQNDTD